MDKNDLTDTLPNCELLSVLYNKVKQRGDIKFNYFGKLDDFSRCVSQEVRQINELFPEYTPHDENYHLSRLFHVADTVLGKERIESMNSSELYVLALALYGHDWGMAVSSNEKQYIVTGKSTEGSEKVGVRELDEDRNRFVGFLWEQNVDINTIKNVDDINTDLWREYVRKTHALRSGDKVRNFFQLIDGGLSEAVSRVCVGHWLDIECLTNYQMYPMDFSVLREPINLRALAIYVRLIDLLDIAEDRTPYVIWKYVDPKNPYSRMEWEKHRALQPITCPNYLEGRIIRVDGRTNDHNVYAALEDLRIWAESQFKECSNVLASMNDKRHMLDIYHIDWRVVASGFKPISIQFEFERNRMFEILSSEIYNDNYYVFLRELLQNSIDAIRARHQLLRQKKVGTDGVGVIRVTVEHQEQQNSIITWQDDGIGMDEYVIRNYLATAGKSYYSSIDFEREGLNIDPISRFGIGVLSCFMVADRVEIETYKDPYMLQGSVPLRVTIPDMRKQFRIEVLPVHQATPGTTFKIFVDGKKFSEKSSNELSGYLRVTDYLAYIAGFVEFPIIIKEQDRKTVIVSANHNINLIKQKYNINDEFQIKQLSLRYPTEEVFYPQDITNAREFLQEISYNIHDDLGVEDCEGIISFLVPKDEKIDLKRMRECWPTNDVSLEKFEDNPSKCTRLRWNEKWTSYGRRYYPSNEKIDIEKLSSYKVYRDGILITNVSPPDPFYNRSTDKVNNNFNGWFSFNTTLSLPLIIVNLSKRKAPEINIARTELLGEKRLWDYDIWEAYLQHISQTKLKDILTLEPLQRLFEICKLSIFYRLPLYKIGEVMDKQYWPVPILYSNGNIIIKEWGEISSGDVYLSPCNMEEHLVKALKSKCMHKEYENFVKHLNIENCIMPISRADTISYYSVYERAIFNMMVDAALIPLIEKHIFGGVKFIGTPISDSPPLIQEIWVKGNTKSDIDVKEVLNKAINRIVEIEPFEQKILFNEARKLLGNTPRLVHFPKEYDKCLAYGDYLLNIEHPLTKELIYCLATVLLANVTGKVKKVKLGILVDCFNNMPFFNRDKQQISYIDLINESIDKIHKIILEEKLFEEFMAIETNLSLEDFIPGTIKYDETTRSFTIN